MVTERTLKRWRKEALVDNKLNIGILSTELNNRILRMTQELLDLHLIKKK